MTVLYGDDVVTLHPPGTVEGGTDEFPWELPLKALDKHPAVQARRVADFGGAGHVE